MLSYFQYIEVPSRNVKPFLISIESGAQYNATDGIFCADICKIIETGLKNEYAVQKTFNIFRCILENLPIF